MDESLTVRRGTELAGADPALRDRVVQSLERCRAGLLQAVTCREYKILSDIADAQAIFAARQRLGEDVIGYAHAVKIDALAALGELMAQAPKAKRGAGPGRGKVGIAADPTFNEPPTLADQGIDKRTANLARKLAGLSDADRKAVASREKTLAEVSRQTTAAARAVRLALPDAKYRVVYADPPWAYRDGVGVAGSVQRGPGAAMQYPTLSIPELCALDIKGIADQDAVLFLWVTSPLLFECAEPVIMAWGFEYKASIVWNKDAHNMGHYVSVQHEFLLICTRGSATPDTTERLPSVVTEQRTRHSAKPERFREMIDAMYPNGKRIELFARREPPAPWDAYGNEVLPIAASEG